MKYINYEDIDNDKYDLIYLITKVRQLYVNKNYHHKLLECDQWINMLNRIPIKTKYTSDAMLALNNILTDGVNYFTFKEPWEYNSVLAIDLINKISKLFKNE